MYSAVAGSHHQHRRTPIGTHPVLGAPRHPSGFLDVLLNGGGHLQMQDQGDVRFVNAHSEGFGRYDHIDFSVAKGVFHMAPLSLVHAGVIWPHKVTGRTQQTCQTGRVRLPGCVHDGALPSECLDHLHHAQISVFEIGAPLDVVAYFRAVGRVNHRRSCQNELKQPDDLSAHTWGSCGGDSQFRHRTTAQLGQSAWDSCVFRPEGVPPL